MIIVGLLGMAANVPNLGNLFATGGIFSFIGVFAIILLLAFIVSGIVGVTFAKKKEKAQIIVMLGIICTVLKVIDIITIIYLAIEFNVTVGMATLIPPLIGFIFPIMYIVCGIQRKNASY